MFVSFSSVDAMSIPARVSVFAATIAASLVAGTAASQAATWNVEAGFSTTANPNGPWSFGGYATAGDTASFVSFTTTVTNYAGFAGLNGYDEGSFYVILQNQSGGVLTTAGVPADPGTVVLHPASNGREAVIRWTAPESMTVDIAGLFRGGDRFSSGTTTDVEVRRNGVGLFGGDVNGAPDVPFSLDVTVAASDTIDFVVGFGCDGNYFNDSTILEATITTAPVPLPASLPLMAASAAALGWMARRRKA